MAKLFKNIAIPNSGSRGISKIYSDSTVNSNNSTFIAIRSQVTNTIGVPDAPQNLIDIRRIGPIYDISNSVPAKQTITFSKNLLRTSSTYSRKRSTLLYDQFPLTNGLLTNKNTPTNDTLIEIKPYGEGVEDRSRMLQNSQALPLVSGPRDVTRIRKYLLSNEGLGFLAFQQRLQAGNTFGQSRGYNPLSIPTAVSSYADASFNNPLVRVSRIISNDTLVNSELWGRLQKETVISTQDRLRVKFVGGAQRRDSALGTIIGTAVNRLINNVLNRTTIKVPGVAQRATNWVNRRLGTNFSLGNTVNLGQLSRGIQTVAATGNAILRGVNASNSTLVKDQTAYDALYAGDLWPIMKENDGNIRSHQGEKSAYLERASFAISKAKQLNDVNKSTIAYGVDPTNDYRSSADYTDAVRSATGTKTFNGITTATYIKDTFNLDERGRSITDIKELDGKNVSSDYITVRFVVPSVFDRGINFRAFIEDFNHNSRGQYDEVRYVGRPERFITYKGMNRSATFSLYLVAFSKEELETIWARANMLNKLVYPIDNAGGFMTPPLAKLTIGSVLIDQPGYVESIDMRFQEIPWDIDSELPMAIKLNMTYNIIEKSYITQNNTDSLNNTQLFAGLNDRLQSATSTLQDLTPTLNNISRQIDNSLQNTINSVFNINTPRATTNTITTPTTNNRRNQSVSGPNLITTSGAVNTAATNLTIAQRISAGEALDEGGNPIINP